MPNSHHFALIGNPVEHSLSPSIHNAALNWAGMEGSYEAIEGDEDSMNGVVERLRSGDLDGVNVTMPLKGAAFEIADVVTLEAEKSKSVNSLRLSNGLVEGHSTDVVAFSFILQRERLRKLTSLLVLGAGGSARPHSRRQVTGTSTYRVGTTAEPQSSPKQSTVFPLSDGKLPWPGRS